MKLYTLLFIIIIISSCSTPYQSKAFKGGYSDMQLDENIFQITFKGNSSTSFEKAVDYALLRSSEITLKNGFNYFQIINRKQYNRKFHSFDPYSYYPHVYKKPRIFYKIKCYINKPEKSSYNAVILEKSINKKYKLKVRE